MAPGASGMILQDDIGRHDLGEAGDRGRAGCSRRARGSRLPPPTCAAAPVVGHGNEGSDPGRPSDIDTDERKTGEGTGRNELHPENTTRSTATTLDRTYRPTRTALSLAMDLIVSGLRSGACSSQCTQSTFARLGKPSATMNGARTGARRVSTGHFRSQ